MNEQTIMDVSELSKHPRNYREHPEEQIEHLKRSIEEHGIYRSIVVANDNTILAGHGVVKACKKMNIKKVPVIRMNIKSDSPQALRLLTADNEISNLADIDDRKLTEILKEINESDEIGLDGTGYDDMTLASLVMVTRPADEIKDLDEAKEWVGMPTYQEEHEEVKQNWIFKVICKTKEELEEFLRIKEINPSLKRERQWSMEYPQKKMADPGAIKFEQE